MSPTLQAPDSLPKVQFQIFPYKKKWPQLESYGEVFYILEGVANVLSNWFSYHWPYMHNSFIGTSSLMSSRHNILSLQFYSIQYNTDKIQNNSL